MHRALRKGLHERAFALMYTVEFFGVAALWGKQAG